MHLTDKIINIYKHSRLRRSWVTIVLVTILAVIPIAYCLPLINLGLEDHSMIEHFSEEDVMFLEFHGQYEKGPFYYPGFRHMNVYPKVYYNLAGLVLYPYSYFFGDNDKLTLVTWRTISMLSASISAILLFAISKRLFESNGIAFLGSVCFLTIPQFLLWSSQVRPNPMEQTLLFATVFMCIKLCEKYSYKTFIVASIFGALAFSTKYGGWIFVFIIPILTVYSIGKTSRLSSAWENTLQQTRVIFLRSSLIIMLSILTILFLFACLLISASFDVIKVILNLGQSAFTEYQFQQAPIYLESYRSLIKLLAIVMFALLSILLMVLVYFWIKIYRLTPSTSRTTQPTKRLYTALWMWVTLQTASIYTIVFFGSGPVYLANPSHLVSQVGFMFFNTALGGSYGSNGIASYSVVLTQLFDQINIGWIVLAVLVPSSIYQLLSNREFTKHKKVIISTLWVYVAITILLVVVLRAGSIRHALPGLALLSVLMTYSIFPYLTIFRRQPVSKWVNYLSIFVLAIAGVFIGYNINDTYEDWKYLKHKDQDTGLVVGSWLSDNYPTSTTVLTDQWNFYIPSKFERAVSTTEIEWAASSSDEAKVMIQKHIANTSPQLIVVTHPDAYENTINLFSLLSNIKSADTHEYKIVKTFDYKYPEKQRYRYKEIIIYEKSS